MYREAPDAGSRASGRIRERRAAVPPAAPSLQGELRHVYLMPDVPPDAAPTPASADEPDSTWETVFAHVRRLVREQQP